MENDSLLQLEKLRDFLTESGYRELKIIEGRGICGIRAFLFTNAIVYGLDEIGFEGRYCYPHSKELDLVYAYSIWDGKEDPIGAWVKHKGYKEYENPQLMTDFEKKLNS